MAAKRLEVRTEPPPVSRQTRALAVLCDELTASDITSQHTELTIAYRVKSH